MLATLYDDPQEALGEALVSLVQYLDRPAKEGQRKTGIDSLDQGSGQLVVEARHEDEGLSGLCDLIIIVVSSKQPRDS